MIKKKVPGVKSLGGRPTNYRSEFCEMLLDHFREGLSFNAFAAKAGVCFDTIHEWVKVHKEFSDAKAKGKAILLEWDEKMLNRGLQGNQRGYNIAAHKWKMTNVHKWSERSEVVTRSADKLSLEELKAEARKLLNQGAEDEHDQD